MLKSSLCDYSDVFSLVKRTVTVVGQEADPGAIAADRQNKEVIIKSCATFTDCVREINSTQVDNTRGPRCCDTDV